MDEEATQPSTQPPRASIQYVERFKGVTALLLPASDHAVAAVRGLYRNCFYNVLACTIQNDEPFINLPLKEARFEKLEDKAALQGIDLDNLAIALRTPRDPKTGYKFGRNFQVCDVFLGTIPKLSNIHFTISENEESGALVVTDLSMNGTTVDGFKLGKGQSKVRTRTLQNGSTISLFNEGDKDYMAFKVHLMNNVSIEYEDNQTFVQGANAPPNLFNNPQIVRKDRKYIGSQRQYECLDLVGQGSFAVVWRAVQVVTGNIVAIKQIRKRGVNREALQKEVQIMEKLNHHNVIQYYEFMEDPDYLNICLEFIEYGDLREYTAKNGLFSESNVKSITRQILRGVEYLHGSGVTHRDLKPENILLSSVNPLVIKISDFGLAKLITSNQSFLKTFCGTMLYLAPEAFPLTFQPAMHEYGDKADFTGSKRKRPEKDDPDDRRRKPSNKYSQSIDIWAIGCIVYWLLTNRQPFECSDRDETLHRIARAEYDVDLLRNSSSTPDDAEHFIANMIHTRPSRRMNESEALRHSYLRESDWDLLSDFNIAEASQRLAIYSDGSDPADVQDDSFNKTAKPIRRNQDGEYTNDRQYGSSFDTGSFEEIKKPAEVEEDVRLLPTRILDFGKSSGVFPPIGLKAELKELPRLKAEPSESELFVTPLSQPLPPSDSEAGSGVDDDLDSEMEAQREFDDDEPKEVESGMVDADNQRSDSDLWNNSDSMEVLSSQEGATDEPGEESNLSDEMYTSVQNGLRSSIVIPPTPNRTPKRQPAKPAPQEPVKEQVKNSTLSSEMSLSDPGTFGQNLRATSSNSSSGSDGFAKPLPVWGRLIPLPGSSEGTVYNMTRSLVGIGRSDRCEVQLEDLRLSRRHVAIHINDPLRTEQSDPPIPSDRLIAFVLSISNNNPVYLNGEPLPKNQPCRIFNGDSLVLLDNNDSFIGYEVELRIGSHTRTDDLPNILPHPSRNNSPVSMSGGRKTPPTQNTSMAPTEIISRRGKWE